MLKKTFLVFAVMCAAILVGCSTTETTNNSNTASNSNTGTSTTAPAPPTTTSTTPATTTTSSGDKIGVPECDDFIAKYEACTSKVPEIARAQYKSAMDQWRSQWKKLAENPETRGSLAAACKQATEQQAAAWKMYGCAN